MMLACQRQFFDVPDDVCYLNSAYMAPRLSCVTRAGLEAIERSRSPWNISPPDFFADVDRLKGAFARLVDADPDDIALVPSVSYGIGVAAANLELTRNQEVVVLAEQFPSNVYPWHRLARETGATVSTVERPQDDDWTRAVGEQISERTAIAALPQAHWTDGTALDLDAVSERCRENGTALVLDLTQSLGAAPFSVGSVRPDFAVAAAYKWLLGPYSLGFLYVAPHLQAGRPLEEAWINRRDSEDFSGLVDYRSEYRVGARRYDVGEQSNFILVPMALAGLQQILDWGVSDIAESLGLITDEIARHAEALGLDIPAKPTRSRHMLGLRFPGAVPKGLLSALADARVHVSVRGRSIRVAPHLHVSAADLGRFYSVLKKFAP